MTALRSVAIDTVQWTLFLRAASSFIAIEVTSQSYSAATAEYLPFRIDVSMIRLSRLTVSGPYSFNTWHAPPPTGQHRCFTTASSFINAITTILRHHGLHAPSLPTAVLASFHRRALFLTQPAIIALLQYYHHYYRHAPSSHKVNFTITLTIQVFQSVYGCIQVSQNVYGCILAFLEFILYFNYFIKLYSFMIKHQHTSPINELTTLGLRVNSWLKPSSFIHLRAIKAA